MTPPACFIGRGQLLAGLAALLLSACGGGAGPFGNPPTVENPTGVTGAQKLSFVYYQRCINPIYLTQLPINQNGVVSVNTCASAGCHDNASGTGGALRIVPSAATVDVTNPANTADVIRGTDMYKNFYSSQGEVVISSPSSSRLINKPLVRGVLHGGGQIFLNDADPNARLILYWMSNPVPSGQDEFSITAANNMFTPPDAATGTCNSQ